MIVVCPICNTKNGITTIPKNSIPKCGKCGARLVDDYPVKSVLLTLPDIGVDGYARVTKLLVQNRQAVNEGQIIAVVETPKHALEIPSSLTGVVSEILVSEGGYVSAGDDLLKILNSGRFISDDRLDKPSGVSTGLLKPFLVLLGLMGFVFFLSQSASLNINSFTSNLNYPDNPNYRYHLPSKQVSLEALECAAIFTTLTHDKDYKDFGDSMTKHALIMKDLYAVKRRAHKGSGLTNREITDKVSMKMKSLGKLYRQSKLDLINTFGSCYLWSSDIMQRITHDKPPPYSKERNSALMSETGKKYKHGEVDNSQMVVNIYENWINSGMLTPSDLKRIIEQKLGIKR